MNHKLTWIAMTISLCCLGLAACGPSQAELDATATQVAADIFATQTAQAPTITPTFTPSPTPTFTPTPTATPTPIPTDTPVPTSTPTPGPDLAELTLDDLPAGFARMSEEEELDMEASYPDGSHVFGYQSDDKLKVVLGVFMPNADPREQAAMDAAQPQLLEAAAAAMGSSALEPLGGFDTIGETRTAGTTLVGSGLLESRFDLLVFRRGIFTVLFFIGYPSAEPAPVDMVALARTLDGRVAGYQGLSVLPDSAAGFSIVFQDDFSDPESGWDRFEDADVSVDYTSDGAYRFFIAAPNYYAWANPSRSFTDVHLEVDATLASGPLDNFFGIFCRYTDNENYYDLSVSSDGYYSIGKLQHGEYEFLTSDQMEFSAEIPTDGSTLRLGASCIGETLTLYVNGVVIATAADDDLSGGDIGLTAGTFAEPEVEILFDNLVVYGP